MTEAQRLAVLDLGSSTFNLLVADVGPADVGLAGDAVEVEPVRRQSVLVELGRSLATTGRLAPRYEFATLVIEALLGAARDAEQVVLVATAAVRAAVDGGPIVTAWEERFGHPIRLLSSRREASLAVAGCGEEVSRGASLFVDSGGASTQVSLLHERVLVWTHSLPLGASRLSAGLSDPVGADEWARLNEQVAAAFGSLPEAPAHDVLCVGGSARRLVNALAGGRRDPLPDLELAGLPALVAELLALGAIGYGAVHDKAPEKAALLLPGAAILGNLLERYGFARARVSPHGLREGVLRALYADPASWWLDEAELAA